MRCEHSLARTTATITDGKKDTISIINPSISQIPRSTSDDKQLSNCPAYSASLEGLVSNAPSIELGDKNSIDLARLCQVYNLAEI